MPAEPPSDLPTAERYVRELLEQRIGPVAHRLDRDEHFIDIGVSSVDLVAVVAAVERDIGADGGQTPDFGEVAGTVRSLAEYCVALRDGTGQETR